MRHCESMSDICCCTDNSQTEILGEMATKTFYFLPLEADFEKIVCVYFMVATLEFRMIDTLKTNPEMWAKCIHLQPFLKSVLAFDIDDRQKLFLMKHFLHVLDFKTDMFTKKTQNWNFCPSYNFIYTTRRENEINMGFSNDRVG